MLTYSMFCLHGVLEVKHLKVWQTFILACNHLVKPCVSNVDIQIAKFLFVKFAKDMESNYGLKYITPVNGHCKQQQSYTEYQQNCFFF